jgi:hypothetical protein
MRYYNNVLFLESKKLAPRSNLLTTHKELDWLLREGLELLIVNNLV